MAMKRRARHLLVAACIAAATMLLPGSVHARSQATAPQFLGAWTSNDSPYAVAVNPQGDVWIAFADTPRIARYDTAGHQQLSVPLDPSDRPVGIATDGAGNAYVADNNNGDVLKYSRSGALAATWPVEAPSGIALDSAGNVFVADGTNNNIVEFNAGGSVVNHLGGQLTPQGVATDGSGNVYVTDPQGDNVFKFSPTGAPLATFGSGFGSGLGQFDIAAYDAVDGGGNLFASDENNARIQEFSPGGQVLKAWGSGGGGNGEFTNPLGVAVDVAGNVYVADEGNARIEKFFNGLEPCYDLSAPQLGACQAAKAVCMAKLAPQDEASCLNATKVQYDAFRGVHAADHATATAKPSEVSKSGHIVVRVQLTAAGAPAGGKKVRLTVTSTHPLLRSAVSAQPGTYVTTSAGSATFTLTASRAGDYTVGVVDVTDGKTFTNLMKVHFH